jgi:chemotaxis protein histidine kinase CheA
MVDEPTSYRGEFFKSPHHAALALVTLGGGFILGATIHLALLVGVAAYALGWIYMPDMPFFRHWVDRRGKAAEDAAAQAQVTKFVQQRDALIASLMSASRSRYESLAAVCRDIEAASADTPLTPDNPDDDPRLRKLDELMWTYLRLLSIEDSLKEFLETERREDVPGIVKNAEAEMAQLSAEFEDLKKKGASVAVLDPKERLIDSKLERLDVLHKRQERIQQAQSNLELIMSEEDRLEQQVKLIRADAMASKNADTLSARIDATVEHLDQTNKWLSEMSDFRDMVGEMPDSPKRIGYASAAASKAPPVIQQTRPPMRMKVK